MKGEFTGKHMAIVVVSGFGVVIAVNLLLATLAVRGFGGVVVENSYVASQEFNGWLDAAERQAALGWTAELTRTDTDYLVIDTASIPEGAMVTAKARRPLGRPETTTVGFRYEEPGRYVSLKPLGAGRWIVRYTITADDRSWAAEVHTE